MQLILAAISSRSLPKSSPAEALAASFLLRAAQYAPAEGKVFLSEAAFFTSLDRQTGRTPTHLILLDPRGKLLSSEAFAAHLGQLRDTGIQRIVLAIGPADGWSVAARARADLLLSLGPMTLPHELTRVVLAEQIYRALTILAGHPYHTGH